MKRVADKFLFFREGLFDRWDEEMRQGSIQDSTLPTQWIKFQGYNAEITEKLKQRALQNTWPIRGRTGSPRPGGALLRPSDKADAITRLNSMAHKLWKAGLRYQRTLGVGGNGLAALFQGVNRDGERKNFVAKASFRGHSLKRERDLMRVRH